MKIDLNKINHGGYEVNNLNSVLVEGCMVKNAVLNKSGEAIFTLSSNRYFKDDTGTLCKEVSYFDVTVPKGLLTERVMEKGKQGRGVRIVGRLRQTRFEDTQPKIDIYIEHIEFQSEFDKESESYSVENEPELDKESAAKHAKRRSGKKA
jgi:single-strand DNA-binding protein